MKERILLVDDDKLLLSEETAYFNSHPDYNVVGSCTNGKDAIAPFRQAAPRRNGARPRYARVRRADGAGRDRKGPAAKS